MPAVEAGSERDLPDSEQTDADEVPPAAEGQPPEAEPDAPGLEQAEQNSTARFIDGLVVLFSYGWLACGVLLLLAIPVAVFLIPRWGRRRGQQ
jgi:hypothetical protein